MNMEIGQTLAAKGGLAIVAGIGAIWLMTGPFRARHHSTRDSGYTPAPGLMASQPNARIDPRLARIVAEVAANSAAQRAHSMMLQRQAARRAPLNVTMNTR